MIAYSWGMFCEIKTSVGLQERVQEEVGRADAHSVAITPMRYWTQLSKDGSIDCNEYGVSEGQSYEQGKLWKTKDEKLYAGVYRQ